MTRILELWKLPLSILTFCLSLGAWPARCAEATAPAAGDWPQWRGPNRDGKSAETGLLQSWPDGGPALLWKAAGLGVGYAGMSPRYRAIGNA